MDKIRFSSIFFYDIKNNFYRLSKSQSTLQVKYLRLNGSCEVTWKSSKRFRWKKIKWDNEHFINRT